MGCCQSKAHQREFPNSEGSFSVNRKQPDKWMEQTMEKDYSNVEKLIQVRNEFPNSEEPFSVNGKQPDKWMEPTVDKDNSNVEKLIQSRNEEDVDGVAQHLSDLTELSTEEVKLSEEGEIMPETVACLGTALLTELTLQAPGKVATCVAKKSGILVEHIRIGSDNLKYWTLGLLSSTLIEGTEEFESVKAALLGNDIFSVLPQLLESPISSIRKRAIQVSAKIYRKCSKGQEAFFNKGGASHLIKLLKNEKSSETEVTPLMEYLSGLLLVTYN